MDHREITLSVNKLCQTPRNERRKEAQGDMMNLKKFPVLFLLLFFASCIFCKTFLIIFCCIIVNILDYLYNLGIVGVI